MKTDLLKFFRRGKNPNRIKLNKQLSAFIVCFLLATIFWFLISLNKNYNSSVSFPIVYADLPKDRIIVNNLPETITLEINARGFDLLGYHLKLLTVPIHIRVQANRAETMLGEKEGYLITKPLISGISRQLRADVRVIAIEPDTIFFRFNRRYTKQIPIKPNLHLFFEKQFNLAGPVTLEPDSIWLTGPKDYVDSVLYLSSEKIVLKGLKESYSKKVNVSTENLNSKMRVIPAAVRLSVPVEKFTEETIEVPIDVKKSSGYRIKTIPDKVKVRYLVALSQYGKITQGSFMAEANFTSPAAKTNSKIKVDLVKKPEFVKVLEIIPSKVDYLKIK